MHGRQGFGSTSAWLPVCSCTRRFTYLLYAWMKIQQGWVQEPNPMLAPVAPVYTSILHWTFQTCCKICLWQLVRSEHQCWASAPGRCRPACLSYFIPLPPRIWGWCTQFLPSFCSSQQSYDVDEAERLLLTQGNPEASWWSRHLSLDLPDLCPTCTILILNCMYRVQYHARH